MIAVRGPCRRGFGGGGACQTTSVPRRRSPTDVGRRARRGRRAGSTVAACTVCDGAGVAAACRGAPGSTRGREHDRGAGEQRGDDGRDERRSGRAGRATLGPLSTSAQSSSAARRNGSARTAESRRHLPTPVRRLGDRAIMHRRARAVRPAQSYSDEIPAAAREGDRSDGRRCRSCAARAKRRRHERAGAARPRSRRRCLRARRSRRRARRSAPAALDQRARAPRGVSTGSIVP